MKETLTHKKNLTTQYHTSEYKFSASELNNLIRAYSPLSGRRLMNITVNTHDSLIIKDVSDIWSQNSIAKWPIFSWQRIEWNSNDRILLTLYITEENVCTTCLFHETINKHVMKRHN